MISILRKLLFVSNTCNTTISLLWKLVYFFFTLIKEINIILRLNLWKKTPSGLRKLCIQFAFEISDHYYSCLSRLKKPLLSLLAMKTFFVVVHETHLYLISKVTTAFFPPVCLLFMKKVHSIAGGGRLTNTCSGTDSTPFYLICTFFFYPIHLFNVILFLRIRFIVLWHSLHFLKIGFLIFILKIFRVFFS